RAVPRRRRGRAPQAPDSRPHRGLGRGVDGARRGHPRGLGALRARAHRGLREAVRGQRHVGPFADAPLHPPARRGRGRLLCSLHSRLHRAHRRAAPHRPDDRRQRPGQRRPQRVRAPPRADDDRGRAEFADAVGPDPLPRDVSILRWRVRDGDRQRGGGAERAAAAGLGERRGVLRRGHVGARPRSGESAGRPSVCEGRLRAGGHPRSLEGDRHGGDLRALLVVRGHVAREPRLLRPRRRLEDRRSWRAEVRRASSDQPLGRRALHEPDRGLGHASARRGGAAGDGPRRRASGRRGAHSPRACLRRWRAVLRNVGGGERAMSAPAVLYEKADGIAVVTMNRPEVHNAINTEMLCRLADAWQDINDDPAVRVAVLTGAGEKAFSAGADLDKLVRMMQGLRPPETEYDERIRADVTIIYKGLLRNYQVTKPLIAAVRGFCVAGGTEILTCTDIRIAGDARFGLAEVKWSLFPMGGSTVRLPRQIAYCNAMEILLTGEQISAERAL